MPSAGQCWACFRLGARCMPSKYVQILGTASGTVITKNATHSVTCWHSTSHHLFRTRHVQCWPHLSSCPIFTPLQRLHSLTLQSFPSEPSLLLCPPDPCSAPRILPDPIFRFSCPLLSHRTDNYDEHHKEDWCQVVDVSIPVNIVRPAATM